MVSLLVGFSRLDMQHVTTGSVLLQRSAMPKKKVLSYNQLVDKILKLCPNAEFGEDAAGQITIETGFAMNGDEDEPLEPLSEIDEDSKYDDDDDDDDDDSDDEEDDDDDNDNDNEN